MDRHFIDRYGLLLVDRGDWGYFQGCYYALNENPRPAFSLRGIGDCPLGTCLGLQCASGSEERDLSAGRPDAGPAGWFVAFRNVSQGHFQREATQ